MNANELFYVAFLPVITIINFCIFGAFYFLVENEPKAGVIKKIEDLILFLPKKLFFIEGVTFKFLLGIGFIVLCFILIINFLNCDTIIEKLVPQYLNNVVNTISGILTPLFSLLAVIAAYLTLRSQRKQNEIQNFENHLFQMIDQQHKLEEKVVNKHGSFRELYKDFCKIYIKVRNFVVSYQYSGGNINKEKMKEIELKIAYYIFYFGADEDFFCDKTFQSLTDKYKLDREKIKALISKLNKEKEYSERNGKTYDLFHTQKSEELGIYYRNLFNAIRYIDWECPYDDEEKKKEYAKLVRTNLSDFAQLMLYYNMQGERGRAWLDNKYEVKDSKGENDCLLTRYKPIKNCAISLKKLEYDTNSIIDVKGLYNMISNIYIELDIDPRNDGREELFSDKVIDYELKIEEKTGDN